jgi:penicillin-binding protein 1C
MKRLIAALLAGAAALIVLAFALDALFPPDLTRYRNASTEILARDGTLLRAFTTRDGTWRLRTDPGAVDPGYLALLLAAEDRRFRAHPGVDPAALLRAAGQLAGNRRIVSGGSTITMQVARLLEPHRRSLIGKLHDIVRAAQLERRYSKDDILGVYLTLAPFGGNLEGVRAASLAYFGKEPARLTDAEAALLVALPQSPTARRPDRHPQAATATRNRLLARLAAAGAITPARAEEAAAEPVVPTRRDFPFDAPQFAAGLARHAAPGARIASTIDAGLEHRVAGVVARETAGLDDKVGVAAVVVDNRSRAIRAIVSGRGPGGDGAFLDLTLASRSPGSALKPFIYGLAFDGLMLHPDTMIDDAPLDIAGYEPQNFDREWHGPVTARQALQQSLNVPAIRVMERVGPDRLVARLRQAGARLRLKGDRPGLAVALGGVGIDLRDLTMLYAALANGGAVAPLETEEGASAPARPFLGAAAAWYLRDILEQSPPPDGVASPYLTAGRAIAFKTGTSYGFRDAWTVAYSQAYTVGVWVGRVEGSPRPGAFGRNTAAPLAFDIFGVLPPEDAAPESRPADAIAAAGTNALPLALRRLSEARAEAARPHLAYPPAASAIDLLRDADGDPRPVTLRAQGGRQPLRWIINGAPVPSDGGPVLAWRPDGPGFVHVTIIDSADRASRAIFRLQPGASPDDLNRR